MNTEPRPLVHMCTTTEWDAARAAGQRRAPSLDTEGFIHLSAPEQVHLPANRLFSGHTDLVLLWLNPELLTDPVKWEPGVPTDPVSMQFPHLYGPIPAAAVTTVTDYRPDSNGVFGPATLD